MFFWNDFTKNPYCSSTLKTDLKALAKYDIKSFFEIKKEVIQKTVTLSRVLEELKFDYIDWFKTDTQGTDLRIFKCLPKNILDKVLIAEFEPGILDAYIGEDKLYKVMEFFENKDFWCDSCRVKGMSRFSEEIKKQKFNLIERKLFFLFQKRAGFWAEISYSNNMNSRVFEFRDYLLMIVFAFIKKQFGFAIELSKKAKNRFDEEILDEIEIFAIKCMRINGYKKLPFFVMNKIWGKVFNV